jgi:hypothetical protein
MGGHQEVQTLALHDLTKHPIPLLPRPRLHVGLRWTLSEADNMTEDGELFTLRCNKGSILCTLFAETVIDVTRLDVKI